VADSSALTLAKYNTVQISKHGNSHWGSTMKNWIAHRYHKAPWTSHIWREQM
jgi:hypothetical protein